MSERHSPTLQYDLLLLITAFFWGTTFVAQRIAMQVMGPFLFSGIRFLLGAVFLLPFLFVKWRGKSTVWVNGDRDWRVTLLLGGGVVGLMLFMASTFQQIGLINTSASKAGFITGLYVVLVPIVAMFWGRRTGSLTWLGVGLSVCGLYLMSFAGNLTINQGDLWVLASTLFYALQILFIDKYARRVDAVLLSFLEFVLCSVLSFSLAGIFESFDLNVIRAALLPLLYTGVLSTGVAFTLQTVAQQKAHPTRAAIIMNLETAFAALAGWLILKEQLGWRGLVGGLLMLIGMIVAQRQKEPEDLAEVPVQRISEATLIEGNPHVST